jgi:hypothetical protein
METTAHASLDKAFSLIVKAIFAGHFSDEELDVLIDCASLARRVAELSRC